MTDGFLGCGDVVYRRKVGNVWSDWEDLGDATKFEIKENADLKERKSRRCASYGNNLSSASIKKPAELSITLDSVSTKTLALLFLGTVVARSLAASTNTDEPHIIANVGSMIKLDKPNVESVVVKNFDDSVTYTLGTDYEIVNANTGMIRIFAGVTILDNAPLLIDYDSKAVSSETITGGTQPSVKVELMLAGKNLDTGGNVQVDVHEAVLIPEGGFDFLGEDYVNYDLGGTLNYVEAKGNAFEVHNNLVNS